MAPEVTERKPQWIDVRPLSARFWCVLKLSKLNQQLIK